MAIPIATPPIAPREPTRKANGIASNMLTGAIKGYAILTCHCTVKPATSKPARRKEVGQIVVVILIVQDQHPDPAVIQQVARVKIYRVESTPRPAQCDDFRPAAELLAELLLDEWRVDGVPDQGRADEHNVPGRGRVLHADNAVHAKNSRLLWRSIDAQH